ncbi:MAG TPA: class I SAM-dependent methyltransferase [Ramlibacter sp.]|nr:class I SAM-dependent methyltransferase [Ramlibacter sp.]
MTLRPASLLAVALFLCGPPPQAQPVEEVPFITSPDNVTLEMLRLAGVGPRDHVIDLGSGDGRIVITAAKRFGASGLGVEIVPDLVQQSLRNARDAGVAERVDFREQDLFRTDLAPASVITMYLLPEVNLQLRPALLALKPGTRVVSHDWDMGDWKPDRTTMVPVPDKKVGLEKSSRVHLWVVPARAEGLWCAPPLLGGGALELTQAYQEVRGRLTRRGSVREGTGRLDGALLRLETTGDRAMLLEVAGDTLRLADPSQAVPAGTVLFTRARGGSC